MSIGYRMKFMEEDMKFCSMMINGREVYNTPKSLGKPNMSLVRNTVNILHTHGIYTVSQLRKVIILTDEYKGMKGFGPASKRLCQCYISNFMQEFTDELVLLQRIVDVTKAMFIVKWDEPNDRYGLEVYGSSFNNKDLICELYVSKYNKKNPSKSRIELYTQNPYFTWYQYDNDMLLDNISIDDTWKHIIWYLYDNGTDEELEAINKRYKKIKEVRNKK